METETGEGESGSPTTPTLTEKRIHHRRFGRHRQLSSATDEELFHFQVRDLEGKLEEGQVFREFEQIPKKRTKCDIKASQHSENVKRNRFKDVCPYDDNRVKLKPSKQLNSQGYINASHIKVRLLIHSPF